MGNAGEKTGAWLVMTTLRGQVKALRGKDGKPVKYKTEAEAWYAADDLIQKI